jgi:RNA polymerase sigma factor (sigma-70 family)
MIANLRVAQVKTTSQNKQSEESLVTRARLGSSDALSELVRLHSPHIYRVSLSILKNHADAEDNLQDVLSRVHGQIIRFKGRSRFSSWIVRIAINEASMKIRKRHSKRVVFNASMPSPEGKRGRFWKSSTIVLTRSASAPPTSSQRKRSLVCIRRWQTSSSATKLKDGLNVNWLSR